MPGERSESRAELRAMMMGRGWNMKRESKIMNHFDTTWLGQTVQIMYRSEKGFVSRFPVVVKIVPYALREYHTATKKCELEITDQTIESKMGNRTQANITTRAS